MECEREGRCSCDVTCRYNLFSTPTISCVNDSMCPVLSSCVCVCVSDISGLLKDTVRPSILLTLNIRFQRFISSQSMNGGPVMGETHRKLRLIQRFMYSRPSTNYETDLNLLHPVAEIVCVCDWPNKIGSLRTQLFYCLSHSMRIWLLKFLFSGILLSYFFVLYFSCRSICIGHTANW